MIAPAIPNVRTSIPDVVAAPTATDVAVTFAWLIAAWTPSPMSFLATATPTETEPPPLRLSAIAIPPASAWIVAPSVALTFSAPVDTDAGTSAVPSIFASSVFPIELIETAPAPAATKPLLPEVETEPEPAIVSAEMCVEEVLLIPTFGATSDAPSETTASTVFVTPFTATEIPIASANGGPRANTIATPPASAVMSV